VVLRDDPLSAVEQLVQTLPEELLARLRFAVTDGPQPLVVLRAKLSREAPPELALRATGYAPLLQLGNLYAPADALVEPPLRRERLRQLLARPATASTGSPRSRRARAARSAWRACRRARSCRSPTG